MRRRQLMLGGCALALVRRARAQAGNRMRRLGVMRSGKYSDGPKTLREALAEYGLHEGQNIQVQWRWVEAQDQADPMAQELLHGGAELIVVHDTPVAHAAVRATRTVPIVLAGIADPVGSGLVSSLARPGCNVTGLSWNLPAIAGKKLELLREMLPQASRFGFLAAAHDPATPLFVESTRTASRQLGVQLEVVQVAAPAQFADAFAQMLRERVQCLVVQPLFTYASQTLGAAALHHRIASASAFRAYAAAGGSLSYGPSARARWRRVAYFVDRLLRGANPGEMPIEDPAVFELVLNLKTASSLGLTVPRSFLLRADEVIQ